MVMEDKSENGARQSDAASKISAPVASFRTVVIVAIFAITLAFIGYQTSPNHRNKEPQTNQDSFDNLFHPGEKTPSEDQEREPEAAEGTETYQKQTEERKAEVAEESNHVVDEDSFDNLLQAGEKATSEQSETHQEAAEDTEAYQKQTEERKAEVAEESNHVVDEDYFDNLLQAGEKTTSEQSETYQEAAENTEAYQKQTEERKAEVAEESNHIVDEDSFDNLLQAGEKATSEQSETHQEAAEDTEAYQKQTEERKAEVAEESNHVVDEDSFDNLFQAGEKATSEQSETHQEAAEDTEVYQKQTEERKADVAEESNHVVDEDSFDNLFQAEEKATSEQSETHQEAAEDTEAYQKQNQELKDEVAEESIDDVEEDSFDNLFQTGDLRQNKELEAAFDELRDDDADEHVFEAPEFSDEYESSIGFDNLPETEIDANTGIQEDEGIVGNYFEDDNSTNARDTESIEPQDGGGSLADTEQYLAVPEAEVAASVGATVNVQEFSAENILKEMQDILTPEADKIPAANADNSVKESDSSDVIEEISTENIGLSLETETEELVAAHEEQEEVEIKYPGSSQTDEMFENDQTGNTEDDDNDDEEDENGYRKPESEKTVHVDENVQTLDIGTQTDTDLHIPDIQHELPHYDDQAASEAEPELQDQNGDPETLHQQEENRIEGSMKDILNHGEEIKDIESLSDHPSLDDFNEKNSGTQANGELKSDTSSSEPVENSEHNEVPDDDREATVLDEILSNANTDTVHYDVSHVHEEGNNAADESADSDEEIDGGG